MALQVSAVLLAAGSSRRMGRLKQLLPLGAKPAIRHCLDSIIASGVQDVVVVVGPRGEEIAEALRGLPVNIVVNKRPESEMADSVRIGLRTLDSSHSGVLICLSDHPLISIETFKAIINQHSEDPEKIIIPTYNGRRGHPSLFPTVVAQEIFSRANLRDLIRKDPRRVRCIEVRDEGVILDMDTVDEYEDIVKRIGGA